MKTITQFDTTGLLFYYKYKRFKWNLLPNLALYSMEDNINHVICKHSGILMSKN